MSHYRKTRTIASLLVALFLLSSLIQPASARKLVTISVTGEYQQSSARSVLNMINELRTSDNVWYYDENNNVIHLMPLAPLTYDYNLEQIAMQRAAEIAIKFGHSRPNGEMCFSCTYDNTQTKGENLAIGCDSDADAFIGLCEENEDYNGQGHRRNMLNMRYTSVGIAHIVVNGVNCYVQEFGFDNSKAAETEPVDAVLTKEVEVETNDLELKASFVKYLGVNVRYGSAESLPELSISIAFPGARVDISDLAPNPSECDIDWVIDDTALAYVSENQIIGICVGRTNLSALITYDGKTCKTRKFSVDVIPCNLKYIQIDDISDQQYTGSPITPDLTLTYNGMALVKGTDYSVSYESNTYPGTAKVKITGLGNFNGIETKTFEIIPDESALPTSTVALEPTPIPTKEPTITPSPTATLTPIPATNTPVPNTATPTPTETPTPIQATPKPTKTSTPKPTATSSPTKALTFTPTPELTNNPKDIPPSEMPVTSEITRNPIPSPTPMTTPEIGVVTSFPRETEAPTPSLEPSAAPPTTVNAIPDKVK